MCPQYCRQFGPISELMGDSGHGSGSAAAPGPRHHYAHHIADPDSQVTCRHVPPRVTCHVSRVQVSSTSGDDTEADKAVVGGDQEAVPPRQDTGDTFPGF